MLWQRVIVAIVAIPFLLATIWFGDPWISIVAGIFAVLGAFEFYRLANAAGLRPFSLAGLLLVLLFVVNANSNDARTTPLLITGTIIVPLVWMLWHPGRERGFTNWAWTVGGVFYLGWTLSHFVLLRDIENGREWVLIALLATFASDTSAFFAGRAIGKHKMAPSISPGKTWEGAVGGMLGSTVATLILAALLDLEGVSYFELIPLAPLISVFAQAGDLVESVLKRNTGAKDAGRLIPGHGGVLDRLDSLVFTIVLVYYWVTWIVQ